MQEKQHHYGGNVTHTDLRREDERLFNQKKLTKQRDTYFTTRHFLPAPDDQQLKPSMTSEGVRFDFTVAEILLSNFTSIVFSGICSSQLQPDPQHKSTKNVISTRSTLKRGILHNNIIRFPELKVNVVLHAGWQ